MTVSTADDNAWNRALFVGLAAYVVSRLCVLAGAGVRAAQQVVDLAEDGEQEPRNALTHITDVFTSWDGLWYLEIVRQGYPNSIPENVPY